MVVPKKVDSIDQKTQSSSAAIQKKKKSCTSIATANTTKPMQPRVTAGETLKHAVDQFFKTHDLNTPQSSRSQIKTNNLIKKKSISKSQTNKDSLPPPKRLISVSSKSLKNTGYNGTLPTKESVKDLAILQPIVDLKQGSVSEIQSIAEESELVIDLTSLIEEILDVPGALEPNLMAPNSLHSLANFIGPQLPQDHAGESTMQLTISPRHSSITTTEDDLHHSTLSHSRIQSTTQDMQTLSQQKQDSLIHVLKQSQLQANKPPSQLCRGNAVTPMHSDLFIANNINADNVHCRSSVAPNTMEDHSTKLANQATIATVTAAAANTPADCECAAINHNAAHTQQGQTHEVDQLHRIQHKVQQMLEQMITLRMLQGRGAPM